MGEKIVDRRRGVIFDRAAMAEYDVEHRLVTDGEKFEVRTVVMEGPEEGRVFVNDRGLDEAEGREVLELVGRAGRCPAIAR